MKRTEYDPHINLFPALESKNSIFLAKNLKMSLSGLEKESIRLDENNNISKIPHKHIFGSSLCNRFFTTDFAESQIEFVTPPDDINNALKFLNSSHHFAYKSLKDEYLWPFSMPPIFDEKELEIASFGTSSLAMFKEIYREGLFIKYGKMTQAISGVHFNYSFSEDFLISISKFMRVDYSREFKDFIYLRVIRNFQRINWLVLFLLGASPFFSKKHKINQDLFEEHQDYLYLPYATSLRMSDIGYQNSEQSNLYVSMNNIEEYVKNIRSITQDKIYDSNFDQPIDYIKPKIIKGMLLIEDEHYGVIRPKSSLSGMLRNSHNLEKNGIDYLEIRSLDIDPFTKIGVNQASLEFIQALILYCALSPSPLNNLDSTKENKSNDKKVSWHGRRPGLKLKKDGLEIELELWATSVIDQLKKIYQILDLDQEAITHFVYMIKDPSKTPSSRILNLILESNLSMNDFGREIGIKSKNKFLKVDETENKNWDLFKLEKKKSIDEQAKIESDITLDFFSFLDSYYEEK